MARHFIGVVSKNHVMRGIDMGIAQVCHGKKSSLLRMKKGDWLCYYSPKISMESNEPLQYFTALGQMVDDIVYQVIESENFKPFRRKVHYEKINEIPIKPFIPLLSFIKNKKSWGYIFRYGLIEIPESDFHLISQAMKNKIDTKGNLGYNNKTIQ
ncbi:MAG: EVE domain-containing protein [Alphaproteobacteria bacterium]|nr:EVE domain-containing protein [Alphaproteobacteria bacterium]